MQVLECKWYLREGYHKKLDSHELEMLKETHICTSIFIQKDHQ
jgi:hypothetical protein